MLKALFSLKVLAIIASLVLAAAFGGVLILEGNGAGDDRGSSQQADGPPTTSATPERNGNEAEFQEETRERRTASTPTPTDSTKSTPEINDPDNDGLTNEEENAANTNPNRADTDADGLSDGKEISLGTDARDRDSDGDGLIDGMEVHNETLFPSADPLRLDVFVEVDSLEGVNLPRDEAERVIERFDNAPIQRNGRQGINLHVVYDETDLDSEFYYDDYAERKHFDRDGQGYYYLLVVPRAITRSGKNVGGYSGIDIMVIRNYEGEDAMGPTFMHELGHILGLSPADFAGIDSQAYSAAEYPSVMNYNYPGDQYGFSTSPPFNDWEHLNSTFYAPSTRNVQR